MLYPNTLSTILLSTKQCYGNILLCETSVFIVKMADHDGNHRCLVKKNVPIALILPSRWQDGAESLGMETTSCLRWKILVVLVLANEQWIQWRPYSMCSLLWMIKLEPSHILQDKENKQNRGRCHRLSAYIGNYLFIIHSRFIVKNGLLLISWIVERANQYLIVSFLLTSSAVL